MNLLHIVKEYLKREEFDGLFNEIGGCACKVDDLMPCSEPDTLCQPGYLGLCDCGDHDWHIIANKPSEV